jgi:hypothetical protein
MFNWTKETAIVEFKALVEEIPDLMKRNRFCAEHTRWISKTLRILEQVFGRKSLYYFSIANLKWYETGSVIVGGPGDPGFIGNPQGTIEKYHHIAYIRDLDSAKGFLMAALDELERSDIESVYEGKDTGPESSGFVKIINLIEYKLRKLIRIQPTKEKEIQDAFENLLLGADIPYGRETESIEYSSKTYIPDFIFKQLDLIVEVKFCNRTDREKEIIAEINDDILAYGTKYGNQIFIVYDNGNIRDVERFCNTFENNEGVLVRVVKH